MNPKNLAKLMLSKSKEFGSELKLGQIYELLAIANGYKNWHVMNNSSLDGSPSFSTVEHSQLEFIQNLAFVEDGDEIVNRFQFVPGDGRSYEVLPFLVDTNNLLLPFKVIVWKYYDYDKNYDGKVEVSFAVELRPDVDEDVEMTVEGDVYTLKYKQKNYLADGFGPKEILDERDQKERVIVFNSFENTLSLDGGKPKEFDTKLSFTPSGNNSVDYLMDSAELDLAGNIWIKA